MDTRQLAAFVDELEKIAEADEPYVTKDKLKRLGKVLLPVGIGTGLGFATGELVNRWLTNPKTRQEFLAFAQRHPAASKWIVRSIPAALGGMTGLIAGLEYLRSKEIQDYIAGRHERKSQQYNT